MDGLAHYKLALCSEHTVTTNLTIGFEVVAGLALLVACSRLVWHSLRCRTPNRLAA